MGIFSFFGEDDDPYRIRRQVFDSQPDFYNSGSVADRIRNEALYSDTPSSERLYNQPLDQEEEQSLLGKIGSNTLEGVGYVGSVLDKTFGGRAVRGLLGGKPEEALSIIPFSDALGITDPSNAVSGEELNRNIGLNDYLGDGLLGTLGGIATEIVLDPSTYLSLGGTALTKTGSKAAKYGYVPTDFAKAATGYSNLDELRWADEALYKNLKQAPEFQVKEKVLKTQQEIDALKASGQLDSRIDYVTDPAAMQGYKYNPDQLIEDTFIGKPLAGPIGVGIPFTSINAPLTGELGAGLVNFYRGTKGAIGDAFNYGVDKIPYARGIVDNIGSGLDYSKRAIGRLFNHDYAGAITPEGQSINKFVADSTLGNVAGIRRDKNELGSMFGQYNDAPSFLNWSIESAPLIEELRTSGSSAGASIASIVTNNIAELKSMYPELLGNLTDSQVMDAAIDINKKARSVMDMAGDGGGILDRTTGTVKSSAFSRKNNNLFETGAIGERVFDDPVYMGTGEVIRRGDSSYFPRQINYAPSDAEQISRQAYRNPATILDSEVAGRRTWTGLPSSLDVERIVRDPEISALKSTVGPSDYDLALAKAKEKIAVGYKGFKDVPDYLKAKNDVNYLMQALKVDSPMQIPNLTPDIYNLVADINKADARLQSFYKNSAGIPIGIFRDSYGNPSKEAIVNALLNPQGSFVKTNAKGNVVPNKSVVNKFNASRSYQGPITKDILDSAFRAKDALGLDNNSLIFDNTGKLKNTLFFVDDLSKNRMQAVLDVDKLAETAAKQSPFYLPEGTIGAAGEVLTEAKNAPYYQHPLNAFETRGIATGRAADRSAKIGSTLLENSKIGQGAVGNSYDVPLRTALGTSNIKSPERAMNYFADNYRETGRFRDTATNPLSQGMQQHINTNYKPREAAVAKSYEDQFITDNNGNIAIEKIKNPVLPEGYDINSAVNEFIVNGVPPALSKGDLEKETYRSLFRDFIDEASGVEAFVPSKTVDNIKELLVPFSVPKPVSPLLKFADDMTSFLKGGLTFIAPAFHSRNYISGQLTNASTGAIGNKLNPLQPFADSFKANKAAMGETITGIADDIPLFREANRVRAERGLPLYTDETATKRFNELMHEYGVYSPQRTNDVLTTDELLTKNLKSEVPGRVPLDSLKDLTVGFWDIFKKNPETGTRSFSPSSLWPYQKSPETGQLISKIEGNSLGSTGSVKDTTFGPFKWGASLNTKVENANRGGAFYGYLRQGFDPETAAMKVAESHVDYSKLTDFEKTYMKRLFPFYTFTRGMIPFVAKNITENPGGVLSQYTKIAGRLRDPDYNNELLPTHLGSSMVYDVSSIPGIYNPNAPAGTRTFFTGLDLPVDTVANYISNPMGDTPFRGAESLLGQLSPYIKFPLELATNRQFFGHRSLDDLYSPTGNRITDQLIGNSPFARVASMARTAMDERKTIPTRLSNLLLGGRFTDIDMPKWESVRAREIIKDALAGSPGIAQFEKVYVRPGQENLLSPKQIELLRLQRTLENEARREKKLRQYNQLPQQPVYIRD